MLAFILTGLYLLSEKSEQEMENDKLGGNGRTEYTYIIHMIVYIQIQTGVYAVGVIVPQSLDLPLSFCVSH